MGTIPYPLVKLPIVKGFPCILHQLFSWCKSKETKGTCWLSLEGIASSRSHLCQVSSFLPLTYLPDLPHSTPFGPPTSLLCTIQQLYKPSSGPSLPKSLCTGSLTAVQKHMAMHASRSPFATARKCVLPLKH